MTNGVGEAGDRLTIRARWLSKSARRFDEGADTRPEHSTLVSVVVGQARLLCSDNALCALFLIECMHCAKLVAAREAVSRRSLCRRIVWNWQAVMRSGQTVSMRGSLAGCTSNVCFTCVICSIEPRAFCSPSFQPWTPTPSQNSILTACCIYPLLQRADV